MELVKNVQQQTITTRLTRTCTRALVTLSSYPGSPGPGLCTTAFILRATQRQRCCHVGGLLPYMIRIACSLSSRLMAALFGAAATAGAAGAADSLDTSGCVVTVAAVIVCQWLHHVRLWLAVAGFGVGIWRVRLLGCASWKQFSCLQKAFCFCEKLTLLHLVPIDEAPASGSMLRAVCVLCGCVHE